MRSAVEEDNAFREELVALLPRLRRFALSLTGDMAEADDLVQAACEKALSGRNQFRAGSRLDRWMFAVIHHLLIDKTRSMRKKKPHVSFDEGRIIGTAINGMRKLEAKLQLQGVLAAMRKLGDTDRQVLALVCIDGMSYKDAAETMQVPVGTVMSRLARARKKLHILVRQDRGSTE